MHRDAREVPGPALEGPSLHAQDLALARAVLAGSTEAWHEFIERYSRLVMAVIHRFVARHQVDEARSLYVGVLESVYRSKLAKYEGRASLATWLVLVTRNAVVDDLRRRSGRRDLQEACRRLAPHEREVFRAYYLEGRPFGEVLRSLRASDQAVNADGLLQMLESIERRLVDRLARRLQYELHAQSVGGASGRLLEYMDHARAELDEAEETRRADFAIIEQEARETLGRVQREIQALPEGERRLLELRFERRWTAGRISDELGLGGQRAVYTWLDRVLRLLRSRLVPGTAREREGRP
jgi:DNA-directed RNA polymerase specialized sigma24 family protein